MLFEINYLKEKVHLLLACIIMSVLLTVLVVVVAFFTQDFFIFVPYLGFLVVFLIAFFVCFDEMEKYEIYEDKIIVKNFLKKTKNVVYFNNVIKIIECDLMVTARGGLIKCYIFYDKRPIKTFFHGTIIDNHKKISVRVPITTELKNFIEKKDIVKDYKDFDWLIWESRNYK